MSLTTLFLRRWFKHESAKGDSRFPIRHTFNGDYRLTDEDLCKHEAFQHMVEAGYLLPSGHPDTLGTHRLNMDNELVGGFTDQDVLKVIDTQGGFGSRAVNEFTAHILINGSCQDTYSDWRLFDVELVHTLLCGVDWKASQGPEDKEWSSFVDTYSPNDNYPVVTVALVCKCGKVGGEYSTRKTSAVEVGVTPLSTADLLRAIESGFLRD